MLVSLCRLGVVFICFFFKQKTSFDMRISDWSSDVCSSDLGCGVEHVPTRFEVIEQVGDEIAVVLDDQHSHGLAPWPQRGLASAQDRTPDVGIAWTPSSEERRVGKEWVQTRRSRWWTHQ